MNIIKKPIALLLAFILALSFVPFSAAALDYTVEGPEAYFEYNGVEYPFSADVLDTPFVPALEELLARAEKENMSDEEFNDEFCDLWNGLGSRCNFHVSYLNRIPMMEKSMGVTFVEAQCRFDPATGTILEVLNDAEYMYIPPFIDGVEVRAFGANMLNNKKQLRYITMPYVDTIDEVFAVNCLNLSTLSLQTQSTLLLKPYANCPVRLRATEYEGLIGEYIVNTVGGVYYSTADFGKSFATASGTIIGDGYGRYNWEGNLTRAQAIVIVLRLLGKDEEALAKTNESPVFSDVMSQCAWANGYLNLAYEMGITVGRGNGTFDPNTPCSANDFITMLYRLTNLEEGVDFSWKTASKDLYYDIHESFELCNGKISSLGTTEKRYPIGYPNGKDSINDLFNFINTSDALRRDAAVDLLYNMLSISADTDHRSLADILAVDHGLSDEAIYNNCVRRTAYGLDAADVAAIEKFYDNYSLPDYSWIHYYMSEEYTDRFADAVIDKSGFTDEYYALANEITAGLTTEYEKGKAIFEWVATHIFYDLIKFNALMRNETYEDNGLSVLEDRRGVCSDYASLTQVLFWCAGLECYYESSTDHAWNVARLDGKWVRIDSTWATHLTYDGKYRYNHGAEISNYLEPNVTTWLEWYFDSDIHSFYSSTSHKLSKSNQWYFD